eukprot:jgi/Mesvir1/23197/Mv22661-RA.1
MGGQDDGIPDVEGGKYGNKRVYTANRGGSLSLFAAIPSRVYVLLLAALCVGQLYLAAQCSSVLILVFLIGWACLLFASYLARWVLAKDEGPPEMREISAAIREGAEGFIRTQYGSIAKMSWVVGAAIVGVYMFRRTTVEQQAAGITRSTLAAVTGASFLFGALCSGVAGYVGMWMSVRANVRVAAAARRSAREALQVAARAGGFAALLVVAMTVLGVASLYVSMHAFFQVGMPHAIKVTDVPLLLVGFGFGASFVALFAQLGGGIYTKAADVGADLVGKVEAGIPEDDPRNPAVIADLVGDNVGDCAARGADLFESISAEVISAMILGGSMARKCGIEDPSGFILFPLVIHSFDLVVSALGLLSIKGKGAKKGPGGPADDPMAILQRGYSIAVALAVGAFIASTRFMLHSDVAPDAWKYFAGCGMVGICVGYLFVMVAQYYTDYKYRPVRGVAEASTTGHATNIIAGMSLGMESTALPVLIIAVGIIASHALGRSAGLVDMATGEPTGGLFGTAVATMGMLSTAGYVLTSDVFGPISDNAGGIVEMSGQPEEVRTVTDLLDAVGNTTKATTKGYSIGSAALAAFLLFSAYMDEVTSFSGIPFTSVDIAVPEVFVAGMLGAMLIFLFAAWACAAVGKSAQEVVNEVRQQFMERPGIMTGKDKPDYSRCVSIVAASALREMIRPGVLATASPIAVGIVFRIYGSYSEQEMLGARAVAGFLMFATVTGILMALFLNTAGGAWDNAKKYVEGGALGGKYSETHRATVTGDTVGDPFKDTAGPSIHVLIKMLATITLVMAPLFLDS